MFDTARNQATSQTRHESDASIEQTCLNCLIPKRELHSKYRFIYLEGLSLCHWVGAVTVGGLF